MELNRKKFEEGRDDIPVHGAEETGHSHGIQGYSRKGCIWGGERETDATLNHAEGGLKGGIMSDSDNLTASATMVCARVFLSIFWASVL